MTTSDVYREQERAVDRIVRRPVAEFSELFDTVRAEPPVGEQDAWTLYADGEIYAAGHRLKPANVCARESLRHDPDSPLAWCLLAATDPDEAWAPVLNAACAEFPDLVYPRMQRGLYRLRQGNDLAAVSELEPLARVHPDLIAPWRALYLAAAGADRPDIMVEAARVCATMSDSLKEHRAYAHAMYRSGRRSDAFKEAHRLGGRFKDLRTRFLPYALPWIGLSPAVGTLVLSVWLAGITLLVLLSLRGRSTASWAWGVLLLAALYHRLARAAFRLRRPTANNRLESFEAPKAVHSPPAPSWAPDLHMAPLAPSSGRQPSPLLTTAKRRMRDAQSAGIALVVLVATVALLIPSSRGDTALIPGPRGDTADFRSMPPLHAPDVRTVVTGTIRAGDCGPWHMGDAPVALLDWKNGHVIAVGKPTSTLRASGSGCAETFRLATNTPRTFYVQVGTLAIDMGLSPQPKSDSVTLEDVSLVTVPDGIHWSETVTGTSGGCDGATNCLP